MSAAMNPISRRGALIAGAALAGGLGLTGQAEADDGRRQQKPHPPRVDLTPAQRAGQRVIYSYPGLTPPAALLDAISGGRAAGVIFFGENIQSLSQISGVVAQLRQASAAAPIKSPLLLMTDQEGGLVRRLPGEPVLSAKQVGASTDPAATAAQAGAGAGENLAGVGMNVNLAPVLDVYRTAGDFDDQFQRSFSSDPQIVATCARSWIPAQQALGVAATVKHFPGLGPASASQNTDLTSVTLTTSLSTLRSVDELPYVSAISAGVKMVMLSWAIYTALDASHPAGLSSTVVGELRNHLGFKGVTITDALEAGALANFGNTGQRAVAAAKAGMDLLLCSARDVSQGDAAGAALADALAAGTLNSGTFDAGAQRVNALRFSLA
jgi:beta-N-acetylhexosaminidase